MPRSLPLFPEGSIHKDGRRKYVHPADVSGRFTRGRYVVFAVLIAIYVALPWVQVGHAPALFLNIEARRFHLFGATFNAQDVWLLFFLVTGVGFSLFVITALLGRLWCGYACPQTVFLEGVFRRVERWIEGPRDVRLKRNRSPWDADKVIRKGIKHALFVLISVLLAHIFISYFVSLPVLFEMVQNDPTAHPEAFAWMASLSGVIYFNFSWFREQLCLVVCPYGRLQSALTDLDTIVVGYDQSRGEPRGKAKARASAEPPERRGDCVDCKRCVVVCPTGIDIRNGLQIECVGCAACVDACDDIMQKLGRPRGLVRYDSQAGLEGKPRRFVRKRMLFYAVLGVVGLAVAVTSARGRKPFEANLLRQQGAPFTLENGSVRNALEIHLVNKQASSEHFEIVPEATPGMEFILPVRVVELASLRGSHLPLFVTMSRAAVSGGLLVKLRIKSRSGTEVLVEAPFLGPPEEGGS